MHARFDETVGRIIAWAQRDSNVEGAIVIGSQVRPVPSADEWSDLDVMLLANDPYALLNSAHWLGEFGTPVCAFTEVTVLHFVPWNWCVKRVLYDDNRDVDFSILPYDQLTDVLSINQSIIAKGHRVIYDSHADLLSRRIGTLVTAAGKEELAPLSEAELRHDLNDFLFCVIWSLKKIKRGELWTAVTCINGHIKDLLLKLIESHNLSIAQKPSLLMYEGRFLEERADGVLLAELKHCFTRYVAAEAMQTLSHLIDVMQRISGAICEQNGYRLDAEQFEMIRQMYRETLRG